MRTIDSERHKATRSQASAAEFPNPFSGQFATSQTLSSETPISAKVVVVHSFDPSTQGTGRRISESSEPASSTKLVLRQPKLHKETPISLRKGCWALFVTLC